MSKTPAILGPQQTVDLIALIGYYAMLAGALAALGVELEPGLELRLPEDS